MASVQAGGKRMATIIVTAIGTVACLICTAFAFLCYRKMKPTANDRLNMALCCAMTALLVAILIADIIAFV
jgi:branched-subunit amino acid transport protein AzlD